MKIGLASYECKNGDIAFNLSQIQRAMEAAAGRADLLCFGESFLQGFDAFSWDYASDREIALSSGSEIMDRLCGLTRRYGTDLLLGYMERDGDALYSSCAVMADGALIHNYRRISKGWKEYTRTDGHYREGTGTDGFLYRGQPVKIALCGDLWDFPERFKTGGLLIWPVYVNFSLDEWSGYEPEYAKQAQLAARRTLMVNSITQTPVSHGGAFYFVDGRTEKRLDYDTEDILIVEL